MDVTPLVGVLVGLFVAWLLFIALLWVLRSRDARLGDLVRVVPDILRLCGDVFADRQARSGLGSPSPASSSGSSAPSISSPSSSPSWGRSATLS